MKANEFVKKFGWDNSKECLRILRLRDTDFPFVCVCGDCTERDDLERLVESHKLIASRGGLDAAKHELIALQKHLNNTFGWVTIITSEKIDRLKQAILDVESCHVD